VIRFLPTILAGLTLVAEGSSPPRAILPDGTVKGLEDASLERLDEGTWPGWRALWIDSAAVESEASGVAWKLSDGQCLVGTFVLNEGRLDWRADLAGVLQLDLERTSMIGPVGTPVPTDLASDRLFMINGDRIDGFVTGFDAERGVGVERRASPGEPAIEVWHPFRNVAMLQLPSSAQPSTGWRFWFRDGSIIDAEAWTRTGVSLRIERPLLPGGPTQLQMPWGLVRGIRPPQGGMTPVSALAWTARDGETMGRLVPAQVEISEIAGPLGIRPMRLAGPGRFVCRLPSGGCRTHLVIGVPPTLLELGGCTVTIRARGVQTVSRTLSGDDTQMTWDGVVEDDRLEIKVTPGPSNGLAAVVAVREGWITPVTAPVDATPPATTAPASPGAQSNRSGTGQPHLDR